MAAALPLQRAVRALDGLPRVPALADPRALARDRRHDDAVAFGVRSTGRIITGAALIMVAVFAGFATGDLVMFQQMGFGLGAAVLLDATVVRCVLVPAAMKLLGEWNWWCRVGSPGCPTSASRAAPLSRKEVRHDNR